MKESPAYWAIVPAAGVGRRMGTPAGEQPPKQYLPLLGRTVIEHSLRPLLALPGLQNLVVAIGPHDRFWSELEISRHHKVEVITGGAERHLSVLNALLALEGRSRENDWVLVHDAVRPCVTTACIQNLVDRLAHHPVGGLLGYPLADTLKRVDDRQRVERTVDRTGLWAASTPQMFRYGLLMKALRAFVNRDRHPTDEAMAVESLGLQPQMVAGRRDNLKITVPGDLELATLILQSREQEAF